MLQEISIILHFVIKWRLLRLSWATLTTLPFDYVNYICENISLILLQSVMFFLSYEDNFMLSSLKFPQSLKFHIIGANYIMHINDLNFLKLWKSMNKSMIIVMAGLSSQVSVINSREDWQNSCSTGVERLVTPHPHCLQLYLRFAFCVTLEIKTWIIFSRETLNNVYWSSFSSADFYFFRFQLF